MLRAACLASFLAIAACISYPELTTVEETRDAPVSPYGPPSRIALVDDADAGDLDGGEPPHPDRDAGAASRDAGSKTADPPPDDAPDDEDDAGQGPGKPKGKGKPPKNNRAR